MSQSDKIWKEHDGFNSVFQNLTSGNFSGTANGVFIVKKSPSSNEIILDFQGSKANLEIERDGDEIYDVSTKVYHGFTTSGKTKMKYETYAWANSIAIELNDEWYGLSFIDGACDMAINGIEFLYKAEKSAEYLIIRVSKELQLTNWPGLNNNFSGSIEEYKKKSIILMPESTLVFAIKR